MESFMNEHQCPLLYVCESLDGLESCRLALFEKWSNALKRSGKIFQHDYRRLEWLDSEILLGIIASPWDMNFELYFREIGTE
ncbi:hypothetical protein [Dyadobacter sp. CY323]|uniref:hypothetical protein n=1 Tax=Dyadobacter sp. CY323 TaxID=2907302 RepID=UPI001F3B9FEC|nr:hypothetical protein [Dyadobacter sp. CY323]